LRRVDQALGRLVNALQARGALIVVTADHGQSLGEGGEVRHGTSLIRAQTQIPLLVAGPGIPARGRVRGVASLVDIAPTLAAAVGMPWQGDGIDLRPGLRAGALPERVLFTELEHTFLPGILGMFARESRVRYAAVRGR
jgi:arylsulfatase A-like enzyme